MSEVLYTSLDELKSFHFHDACLERIKRDGQTLIWTVSALNVMQGNSQNPNGPDQCINAEILFQDGQITDLVFPPYQLSTGKVKNITVSERRVSPEQYQNVLSALLEKTCYILELESLEKVENGYLAQFFVSGHPGCLLITVSFQHVLITLDCFLGPAWYVNWP